MFLNLVIVLLIYLLTLVKIKNIKNYITAVVFFYSDLYEKCFVKHLSSSPLNKNVERSSDTRANDRIVNILLQNNMGEVQVF